MKRYFFSVISITIIIAAMFSLSSCLLGLSSIISDSDQTTKQEMNIEEFNKLLSELPAVVVSKKINLADDNSILDSNSLQVSVKNNSNTDIKDLTVAYAGWDSNNLPLKIERYISLFTDIDYVIKEDYNGVNMVPGSTVELDKLSLDDDCKIVKMEAVCVKFETFDGRTWNNPYFEEWKKLYKGVKYSDNLTVTVNVKNNSSNAQTGTESDKSIPTAANTVADTTEISEDTVKNSGSSEMNVTEFNALLSELPVTIISKKIDLAGDGVFDVDSLQVSIKNNTNSDIKDVTVAYVGWDGNDLPVKINEYLGFFSTADYVVNKTYEEANIPSSSTYSPDKLSLDSKCKIERFEAVCVRFVTFDGKVWSNPYFDEWKNLYAGVKYSSDITVSVKIEDASFSK